MGTLIHKVGHGLVADDTIMLGNLVGGAGLEENHAYYVLAAGLTADDFAISETSGGAAVEYTTDITDGVVVLTDIYTPVADGVMDPPDVPDAPDVPVLSSTTISGIVTLTVEVAPLGTTARVTEVTITHEFSGATPVWDSALIQSVADGSTSVTISALGGTKYAVRCRVQDVYGQFSPYSTVAEHTTLAGSDSLLVDTAVNATNAINADFADLATNVTNVPSTVVVDSSGITINDGALILKDGFGKSVLGASGFSGSWYDFVRLGLYNARFLAATAATNIATGRTAAMPYWELGKTGSPTIDVVANTGLKVNWAAVNNVVTAKADAVPVLPSQKYQVPFTIAYSGVAVVSIGCTVFWYKNDGSASTTPSTAALYRAAGVSVSGTGTTTGQFDPVTAPSDARFAVVVITLTDTLHSASQTTTLHAIGFQQAPAENITNLDFWLGTGGSISDPSGNLYEPAAAFQQFAYAPGLNNESLLTGSVSNLAIVSGGSGGAFLVPVVLAGPMYAAEIVVWNTDTSLARTAEVAVYRAEGGSLANCTRLASGTLSFTPSAAAVRAATLSGGPVYLPPGGYLLAIRNTSTARTFGLGGTANSATPFPTLGVSGSSAAFSATFMDFSGFAGFTGSARGLGLRASGWG